METLLAFDYGTRRIGVAVGQRITGTATALCTLPAVNDRPDWQRIGGLIGDWQPDGLVVGLPLRADGSDSATSRSARKFAQQLEGRYGLPVYLVNERLSSHAARERQGKNRAGIDAVAARIILQDWLDTENSE